MSQKKQPGRASGFQKRKVGTRQERQRFLIVCEGEKTEPAYFKAFQVPGLVVTVHAVGKDPLTLVKETEKRVSRSPDSYDQVWCVFDCDDFLPERIWEAIRTAKQKQYNVAISNQSFELWYVLHFEFLCTAISRQGYIQKLGKLLGSYQKNDPGIYEKLQQNGGVFQKNAVQNARRLFAQYERWDPVYCDPSTTVYELVEELNKHRRS